MSNYSNTLSNVPFLLPTPAQRRLWLISQGNMDSALYNVPFSLRLRGTLDREALEKTIIFMIERHPVLRSQFHVVNGELQIVLNPQWPELRISDLSDYSPEERETKIQSICDNEVRYCFNLSNDLPFRYLLLRRQENDHQLIFTLHHIVFDDWSTHVFLNDFSHAYNQYKVGQQPKLATITYPHVNDSITDIHINSAHRQRLRNYWGKQLVELPELHKLPTDRPRLLEQRGRGAVYHKSLPLSLVGRISKICQRYGLTPYMVAISAFTVLLNRYSHDDDIVIGSPFANRHNIDEHVRLGFFINLLPLRFRVNEGISFSDLLVQARDILLDAYENADLPFDEIVDVVQPLRSLSHSPVFQIMFDYLKSPGQALQLDGLAAEVQFIHSGTAKYDLTLSIEESPSSLLCLVEFDTDLFDNLTITRMVNHYETLLDALLSEPERSVAKCSMLPPEELETLARFSRPAEPLPVLEFISVAERIKSQVRNHPDARAMVWRDQRFTYAQLDEYAQYLLAKMRQCGVGPGSRVAVLMSYRPEIVISFYAILSAGAVYVPLSPSDPRFADKINDAQPVLILTSEQDAVGLLDFRAIMLDVDELFRQPAPPDVQPIWPVQESDSAYVIYTSGSTGNPKGVEVSHGSLHASYHAWCHDYRFTQPGEPVSLQLAAPIFDLSIGDFSRTLGCGGCLVMCPREWLLDAPEMHRLMMSEGVTFGDFPPVVLRQLIQFCQDNGKRLDGLSTLVCGADVWFGHELHAAQALCRPDARILGSYGVTEATIDSTVFDPETHPLETGRVIPLGRPLASCELFIVDKHLQQVPIGVSGELLIAGVTVAKGYLNNPQLTAEKFITGKFDSHGRFVADGLVAENSSTRFYRTSDICCFLADGTIDFMGRSDHQIKIRGFRVELGEVESALLEHADVRQCAVVACNDSTNNKVLVAYVVSSADTDKLRGYLSLRLPGHMMPRAFVFLDKLPTTPNGKVDRKRLQVPDFSLPENQESMTEPANAREEQLLALWRTALGVQVISTEDNFFYCGGNSLIAANLITQINKTFSVQLKLSAIFNHPTIVGLASLLGSVEKDSIEKNSIEKDGVEKSNAKQSVTVQHVSQVSDLLSFGQRSLWLIAMQRPDDCSYNVPFTLRLHGNLHFTALMQALNDIVQRHDVLRTTFSSQVSKVSEPDGTSSFEPSHQVASELTLTLRQQNISGGESALASKLREEMMASFDLVNGPLIRAVLFTLSPQEHVLCITLHHIISDGRSLAILFDELRHGYQARLAGKAPMLPMLEANYGHFISWQRSRLTDPAVQQQIHFWRQQLADAPATLILNEMAAPTDEAAAISCAIPHVYVEGVEKLAREQNCTPFMVWLSLFALLLRQQSGEQDLIVGTPVSLRTIPAWDTLIGYFANTLPVRINSRELQTFQQLLMHTRQVSLDILENRDLPFDYLVQTLNLPRVAGKNPVFQTIFSCELDQPNDATFGDMKVSDVELGDYRAKIDLELAINRVNGQVYAHFMAMPGGLSAVTLGRMSEYLLAMLPQLIEKPDTALADLLTVNSDRSAQPELVVDKPQGLFQLFQQNLSRYGGHVALESDELSLSYQQLDTLTAYVAQQLQQVGVGRGDRVGILMGHHPHNVTAMLAINRIGAVFVPLAPDNAEPANRYVIDNAEIKAILCRNETAPLCQRLSLAAMNIDELDIANAPYMTMAAICQPDDCAYVIYTSGSTGKPKGVAVTHRSVCHNILAIRDELRLEPSSRIVQYSSPVFDVMLGEIFPALVAGACVVFANKQQLLPGSNLTEWLAHKQITHMWIVPSALAIVPLVPLPSLQVIIVTGEPCMPEVAQRWSVGRRLMNGYGPTECAIVVSLTDYHAAGQNLVLRPMGDVRFHLLDEQRKPVAPGEMGELYLAGTCVAQGYLGMDEKTAGVFLPDSFAPQLKARMYRTGDIVRQRMDGALEFIGRVDRQVKIRGYRIELNAVRAALSALPGVRQAEALAITDSQGNKELAGYIVGETSRSEILSALRQQVSEVMVPTALFFLDALPTGITGKVDLKALAEMKLTRAGQHQSSPLPAKVVSSLSRVEAIWRELLERDEIGYDENFFDAGGHSLRVMALFQQLNEAFGVNLSVTDIFAHPTIRQQAQLLDTLSQQKTPVTVAVTPLIVTEKRAIPTAIPMLDVSTQDSNAIAIIGMTGRFPQAPDLDTFWQRLLAGYDASVELSDEELLQRGVNPALLSHPQFVRRARLLEGCAEFDARFFGYSSREAQVMDPQQRLFLEMAWETLELSGYGNDSTPRSVGVFGSSGFNYYLLENVMPNKDRMHLDPGQWQIGNDKDFIATRAAYKLNLSGPSVSIGTACSSSLTAIHFACESLRRGECDMALAGAVALDPQQVGFVHVSGGIMSPDGLCRPFDAAANGTASGSGGGMILLKRLSAALQDGDTIHAVIKGSAINNDGAQKVSYTAPSIDGQSSVIKDALRNAGVSPASISYIEAHGTATSLGDPVEIRALTQAFLEQSDGEVLPVGSCAIGSVKGNIGHIDAAAGIAGVIKTVLALRHQTLPPSIHYHQPNPAIPFEQTPFSVINTACPWPQTSQPRRAGVSSFGIGGSNAHLILEEAPRQQDARILDDERWHLLPISAKTPQTLLQQGERLAVALTTGNEPLADIAGTLQQGRSAFSKRAFVVGKDREQLINQLRQLSPQTINRKQQPRAVIFMFPGQGSQSIEMGQSLYLRDGVFRQQFDRCAELLQPHIKLDIRQLIYPQSERDNAISRLNATRYTQPALFTVEYALACQLQAWGITPQAMIGHSLGELVAACVGGMLELEDTLALVANRAAIMQRQPTGAMLAVQASSERMVALAPECEFAALNGPAQCVITGSHDNIAVLEEQCNKAGISCQRLTTSHAFHSSLMDAAAQQMREFSAGFTLQSSTIPMISNISGRWFSEQDRDNSGYWGDHLRRPVRFYDGILTLLNHYDNPILLEVGPGRALTSMLKDLQQTGQAQILTTMRHTRQQKPDEEVLLNTVGQLWQQGVAIDWAAFGHSHKLHRVMLPVYPLQRQHLWLEQPVTTSATVISTQRRKLPTFTRSSDKEGITRFTCKLDDNVWFIDEHRIFEGQGVLPGTGCLELVRRVFNELQPGGTATFSEVYFPSPLVLSSSVERQIRISLTAIDNSLAFTLESHDDGNDMWQLHANGNVTAVCSPPAEIVSPYELRRNLQLEEVAEAPERFNQAFADYGPRWQCIAGVWMGDRCALAQLRLNQAFIDDLPDIALHPALLDLGTVFLHACLLPGDASIPFHYGSLTLHQPLCAEFYSLAVETAPRTYDITLFSWDERQNCKQVLAEIHGYNLRQFNSLPFQPASESNVARWCRYPRWLPKPLGEAKQNRAPWLIFGAQAAELSDLSEAAAPGSIVVEDADEFLQQSTYRFSLRKDQPEDYQRLIDCLIQQQVLPERIIWCWTAAGISQPEAAFEQLATAIKALTGHHRVFNITLISRGLQAAKVLEACNAAPALGLLGILAAEYPGCSARHIDLNDDTFATYQSLIAELYTDMQPEETTEGIPVTSISLKQGERELQTFTELDEIPRRQILRDGGVYLITGGLGGIGQLLARHISNQCSKVKLGILSRRGTNAVSEALLDVLQKSGAEVMMLRADVADDAALTKALAQMRARFGAINGVIHSAGIEASGLLEHGTSQDWRHVMAAKVSGTQQLMTAISQDPLDFVLLCSSLASLVGGMGQADYAAANRYLDAVAHYWRQQAIPVTSVNWDTWAEVGMAVDYAARRQESVIGLSNQEGCAIFDLAIAGMEAQIVVNKFPPVQRTQLQDLSVISDSASPEEAVRQLWYELLGEETIHLEDDFFELGGHSLLATQMISRLRDHFQHCLTLAEFLEQPTMARVVRSLSDEKKSSVPENAHIRYCLVPINHGGNGNYSPFFCVPGMGGNVTQFMPLAGALPPELPFIGMQYLGLDGKTAPHQSVEEIATHYIACLRSAQKQGPYHIGGHSLGGKVAYEMARQLHAEGESIGSLVLLDSAAPPYAPVPYQEDADIAKVILGIFAYYTNRLEMIDSLDDNEMRALPREALLSYIKEQLKRFSLIQAQNDMGSINGLFNVYRAASDMSPKYRPIPVQLPIPMLLVKAVDPLPKGVVVPEIRETNGWGWEKFSTLPIRIAEVPGNHYSCLMEEHVAHVSRAIIHHFPSIITGGQI
ncbi:MULTISPECIES: hybrid non-ribosomal peptide synthetase/type I polyketide synthase [unclassified Photorhabdus]|uniref:hybrid non-ribosomal peptide synthetase/type I polyketide synthase n=1 Tax=unclassified Photorhabdus TaxID=2620880 RepID=UPI001EFD0BC6|nr:MULTISPECIES: hybrid non-ribosomal peptide synthetase/type I polyketide synthase [unclassified Photorhabdus]